MRKAIYGFLAAALVAMIVVLGIVDLERYIGTPDETAVDQSRDSGASIPKQPVEALEVEDLRRKEGAQKDRADKGQAGNDLADKDQVGTVSQTEAEVNQIREKRFPIPESRGAAESKSMPSLAKPLAAKGQGGEDVDTLAAKAHDRKAGAKMAVKNTDRKEGVKVVTKDQDRKEGVKVVAKDQDREKGAKVAAKDRDRKEGVKVVAKDQDRKEGVKVVTKDQAREEGVKVAAKDQDRKEGVKVVAKDQDRKEGAKMASKKQDRRSAAKLSYTVLDEAYTVKHGIRSLRPAESGQEAKPAQPPESVLQNEPESAEEPETFTRHPYSIILGIYMTVDDVERARLSYQSRGLSAYWVRVWLSKGNAQYRLLTGAFATMKQAKALLAHIQIPGAQVVVLEHACLVGTFASKAKSLEQFPALVKYEYYPHGIETESGRTRLYAGAYFTLEGARHNCSKLISKGFPCQVVER